ncbi:MAG: hypothetical protein L0Y72_18155 [Gemmataceae bacterium]|nr:hypothetical protein [Gemmataceae bacterium]MCI0740974.1 hypothetical protein [Gemmataceae bacterium]
MSDMSRLSHEYASSADFSRALNAAALRLKKKVARGRRTGEDEEDHEALRHLRSMLTALVARLEDTGTEGADVLIPEDIFERIVDEHRGESPHFVEDLKHVLATLESAAGIGHVELKFLDSLCEAADASASAAFRKLWRR